MTKRVGRRSPTPNRNPQGNYRPPYSRPPTTYPYPKRNRSAEIITISLLVAAFLLLGMGGMLWLVQTRVLFGPTPTPTPTQGPPLTATPDFASTRVAEDFLTQQAYQMAVLGTVTPTPMNFASPTQSRPDSSSTPLLTNTPVIMRLPGVSSGAPVPENTVENTPESTLIAEGEPIAPTTPTTVVINLPMVVDSSPLATPTPAAVAELPSVVPTVLEAPTDTPAAPLPETPVEIPSDTPTATPLPATDTPSPMPTNTVVPPTPTATAIPPGQPLIVSSLQGFVQDQNAPLHIGPSNIYTQVAQLAPQTKVSILYRNPSGEWLFVCCAENQSNVDPAWVRQAYVRPRGNPMPNGAPANSNPDDVRWLEIKTPSLSPPLPVAVPPGPDDFPLARYDRNATGRVDLLPKEDFTTGWGAEAGRAGGPFVSPVAVMGQNVIVSSADNHLYSFDRFSGSQRWRFNFCSVSCAQVTVAPMTYDNEIFVVDQTRTVWDLQENLSGATDENAVNVLWRVSIEQPALTSFNIFSDTLFLATGSGANHTLLALDRDNGANLWSKTSSGPGLRYPAIGDQLVYAADGVVTAYDVINGEQVWVNPNVQNIAAGPVYGSPGISSTAELYMVANNNRIYNLDANTGVELWNIDNGEVATSLALNQDSLFVAGDGYVKAISRFDHSQRWRTAIQGGPVMGGPLVDGGRVLVVTKAGNIYLIDSQSGAPIVAPAIAAFAGGDPAVSGSYIFVPGSDGRLYELLSNQ